MRGWFLWRGGSALSVSEDDRSAFSEIEASTSSLSSLSSPPSSSSLSPTIIPQLSTFQYSIINDRNDNTADSSSISTNRNKRRLMIKIITVIIIINITIFVIIYSLKGNNHNDDAAVACTSSDCSVLTYHSFNSDDNNAMCNDGTFGGYYYKASTTIDSPLNVYLILLPGGAQCYDQGSCLARSSSLSSSSSWPRTISGDGILSDSATHSPIWYANKAYLGYCSSDGYMGNLGASPQTWGLHFRGQALIDAMIYNLRKHHGLNDADLIVFAGLSAGARGVMTNIDRLIDSNIFPQVPVIGFIDSPYYLDVVPYDVNFIGFPYAEQHKYMFMNTSGILSPICKNDYITNEWRCQLGQYRMPYVKAPYFFVASRYDTYQLGNNLGPPAGNDGSYSTAQIDWANRFANLTLLKLNNLVTNASNGHLSSANVSRAFFVNACFNHAVSGSQSFYGNMKINGYNLYDAFSSFMKTFDNPMTVSSWIDSCNGFACASSC